MPLISVTRVWEFGGISNQTVSLHFTSNIINCLSGGPGLGGGGVNTYSSWNIRGNYCSMSIHIPSLLGSGFSFGSGRAPSVWKFPTFLPGVGIDIFSKNTLKNSSTLLKLSFEICLQLYSHTDYSKIEDARPEASWVYSYTKKEMIAINEVNLVCFLKEYLVVPFAII